MEPNTQRIAWDLACFGWQSPIILTQGTNQGKEGAEDSFPALGLASDGASPSYLQSVSSTHQCTQYYRLFPLSLLVSHPIDRWLTADLTLADLACQCFTWSALNFNGRHVILNFTCGGAAFSRNNSWLLADQQWSAASRVGLSIREGCHVTIIIRLILE